MAASSQDAFQPKPGKGSPGLQSCQSMIRGFSFLDEQQLKNMKGWTAEEAIAAAWLDVFCWAVSSSGFGWLGGCVVAWWMGWWVAVVPLYVAGSWGQAGG